MMGVGAIRKDVKTMILSGVAGLVAGACSMAIGELVFVYSLYDIEMAQMKRKVTTENMGAEELDAEKEKLPNPWLAAGASAFSFVVGALVPLLGAI
jgi:VIT1/CCC1 family predicted Fe2+/Mn2+ transporter|uniref:Vacuolar iron transporter n=1 Tax=Fagus sylvatica TaxID=28930 RepID=A0A2N9FW85_FAGSY